MSAGQRTQGPAGGHHGVVRGDRGKLVGRRNERQRGFARDQPGGGLAKADRRVQARAYRSSADRKFVQSGERPSDVLDRVVQLSRPARCDLAQGDRRGILQMGAPQHDQVGVLDGLGGERIAQRLDSGKKYVLDLFHGGDVHHGGKDVVGGLAAVDVVVWMKDALGSGRIARVPIPKVRDHLVGVHVGLRAGSGLENGEREFVVPPPIDHLLRGANDQSGLFLREVTQLLISQSGALLHDPERPNDRPAPSKAIQTDGKGFETALRLRAP
jgi:hypothetical protein